MMSYAMSCTSSLFVQWILTPFPSHSPRSLPTNHSPLSFIWNTGEFILTGHDMKLPAVCKTIYSINDGMFIHYHTTTHPYIRIEHPD